MLSSLFPLYFRRCFKPFVSLVRYCFKRKGDTPQGSIDECQGFLYLIYLRVVE